jgi:bifunctional non-homologous end joining protein LigD
MNPEGADPRSDYRKGRLKFQLHGHKLKGRWILVRTRRDESEKQAWLLIKENDEAARIGSRITDERPESVATGRRIEEIAKDKDRVWHSNKSKVKAGAIKPHTRTDIASVQGARKAPMPEQLKPELATLLDVVPDGSEWLHEIKYDGYRILTRIERGHAVMFSRNGHDWSAKFPSLTATLARVPPMSPSPVI